MTVPETPLPDRLAAALRAGTTLDLSPDTSAGELIVRVDLPAREVVGW